jgi:urease subunit alpha
VRLADTGLLLEVERDLTTPGDEAKFGGGKVLRDGMGQSARASRADGALDLVITNAVVLDTGASSRRTSACAMVGSWALGKAGEPRRDGRRHPGDGGRARAPR